MDSNTSTKKCLDNIDKLKRKLQFAASTINIDVSCHPILYLIAGISIFTAGIMSGIVISKTIK